MLLSRSEYWQLEVHWYPHAVEAGVRPVPYECFAGFDDHPGYYWPRRFDFDNPPSRQDFLSVCKMLPWTHGWKADLLDLIDKQKCDWPTPVVKYLDNWTEKMVPVVEGEKCDWPMIDYAHKGASAPILDDQGRQVGELRVWKHDLWVNEPYGTTLVTVDARDRALRGYRGEDRTSLAEYLRTQENRIREDMAKVSKAEKRPVEDSDLHAAVHQAVLRWRQLRKQSRKRQTA